jgi:putative nucleotidyltransferase with HDIG domain
MADVLIDGPTVRAPASEVEKGLDAPSSTVSEQIAPAPARYLPHMLIATTVVAVLPLALSLGLRASGVISSPWLSVGLALALSMIASRAGSAYWSRRDGHAEVLFSELLLWGWIRRWRQERELADATRLLDLVNPGFTERNHPALTPDEELTVEQREQLLRQLAGTLEGQDIYLNGHSRRVARHATMIARGVGLSSDEVARVRAAAAVHDVGKLRTPKAILNKTGRLTDEEFAVIKRHPVDGAEMVAALGDPELTRIVRHHHERLDGAGYPDGLAGQEIPIGARIIAVADTFDAITSARPYRDAAPHQKALDILRNEAGAQLDPDAVRSFLAYYSGNRPTVLWAIIASSVRRVVAWLSGDPAAAATLSASKVAVATAATAAIGAAAGAAPLPVLHLPSRPAAAVHAVPARRRGATPVPRRPGTVVTLPGAPAKRPGKTAQAASQRRAAHAATARRQARRGKAKQAHPRGSGAAGTASPAAGTPASTGASGAPRSGGARQGAGVGAASNHSAAAGPVAPAAPVVKPTPPGHTHASNGNAYGDTHTQTNIGNAYGHTNTHGNGNGHGNGNASGHGNASTPSSSGAPATGQGNPGGNGNGHGNASGQSHGGGNGNGHANGNGSGHANASSSPATATPTATTPTATTPTVTTSTAPAAAASSAGGDSGGNHNGAGNGNGRGAGSSAGPNA